MSDDGIRERHGMGAVELRSEETPSSVIIIERDDAITINACSYGRRITPADARYLASKLNRLARRIEERQG